MQNRQEHGQPNLLGGIFKDNLQGSKARPGKRIFTPSKKQSWDGGSLGGFSPDRRYGQ